MDAGSVRALVGLAGPYAFDPQQYDSTRPIFAGAPVPAETVPANLVTAPPPPMLLLHGLDDDTVYPVNSETFAERARAAGGRATLIELPDTGHIGIVLAFARPFRREGGVLDTVDAFLRRQATDVNDVPANEPSATRPTSASALNPGG